MPFAVVDSEVRWWRCLFFRREEMKNSRGDAKEEEEWFMW
jgi:hypothetical protein